MKKKILLAVGFIISSAPYLFAQKDSAAQNFAASIKAEDLKKHLLVLASKEYEGRETGTEGQKKTIKYLAGFYKDNGLENVTPDFFQSYDITLLGPDGMFIDIDDKKYEFLKDYYYFPGFEDVEIVSQDVIFCGYGISDTARKYDDYKGLEVKDKVVAILEDEPMDAEGNSLFTGKKDLSHWSTNRRLKIEQARKRGAKALLIVVDKMDEKINKYRHSIEKPQANIEKKEKKEEKRVGDDKRIPMVYISYEMADRLFGKDAVKGFRDKINADKKTYSAISDKVFHLKLKRVPQKQTAENVLGFIKGSEKPEEVIVISAHLDHLGKHGDKIYYGADDDGSGTVAVLELAQAFKEAAKKGFTPKRSLLFINFSGEEKGLLGSQYYSEHPVFPLENTVADLNIDMIGRLDKDHANNPNYTYVIGSDKLSTDLHKINEAANKNYVNIDLDYTYNRPNDPNRFYYRSDHYNFAKNNVPVIFYFTGVHEDYHQPTDTVDKIDFNKMEKITRLVFYTAWELANRKDRIKVDSISDMPATR